MAEEIKVTISADASQLQSELKKAETALKSFQSQFGKGIDETELNNLKNSIAQLESQINSLKSAKPVINIIADPSQALSQIQKTKNSLNMLQSTGATIDIAFSSGNLQTDIKKSENLLRMFETALKKATRVPEIEYLQRNLDLVKVKLESLNSIKFDSSKLVSGIVQIENQISTLKALSATIIIKADADAVNAEILKAENNLVELKAFGQNINLGGDITELKSNAAKAEAIILNLKQVSSSIKIGADLSKLNSDLLKAESELMNLKTLSSLITIKADSTKLQSEIQKAEKKLIELQNYSTQVTVSGDSTKLQAEIIKAQSLLSNLKSLSATIPINADTTQLTESISSLESQLAELRSMSANIPIDGNSAQFIADINKLENELVALRSLSTNLVIGADSGKVELEIKRVQTELTKLRGSELIIPIETDTTRLRAELIKAENELKNFKTQLTKSTSVTEILALQTKIGALEGRIASTSQTFTKLGGASSKANFALTDLGRVVQDAPYGWIGIQNNISPLFESFTRLKNDAGGVGGAFKQLGQSLGGVGGIGLGIAVVTSLITVFHKEIFDSIKGVDKLAESLGKLSIETKLAAETAKNFQDNISFWKDIKILEIRLKITGVDDVSNFRREIAKLEEERTAILEGQQDPYSGFIKQVDNAANSVETAARKIKTSIEKGNTGFMAGISPINEYKNKLNGIIESVGGLENAYLLTDEQLKNFDDDQQKLIKSYVEQKKALDDSNGKLTDSQRAYRKLTLEIQVTKQIEQDRLDALKKKTESMQSIMDKFEAKLIAINRTGLTLGTPNFKISEDQIKAFESVIDELINKFPKNKKLPDVLIKYKIRLENLKTDFIDQQINETLKGVKKQQDISIFFNQSTIDEQITMIKSAIDSIKKELNSPLDPRLIVFKIILDKKQAEKKVEDFKKYLQKVSEDVKIQAQLDIALNTSKLDVIKGQISKKLGDITDIIKNWNDQLSPILLLKWKSDVSQLRIKEVRAKVEDLKNKTKDLEKLSIYFDESTISEQISNIKTLITDIQKDPNLPFMIGTAWIVYLKAMLQTAEAEKKLQDFQKGTTDLFNSMFQNIAVSIGETIGNALTGKANIGDFFKGIYQQIGEGLVQLGKYFIKTALIIELIKTQLIQNPVLAVAAGIALLAIGTAIKNTYKQPAFAVGTRNAPGGLSLVGERGPELINLPRGSQVIPAAQTSQMMGGVGGQIEVFGMLRGQDIFFSNKKYGQTYGRTT